MTEAFHLQNVKVTAGGRDILDIGSLKIPHRSFVAIVGTNGAGKTTLLKTCAGLIKPAAGTVSFAGKDITTTGCFAGTRLRRDIGYVPQRAEYNAQLPFTAKEIVLMGRTSRRGLFRRLGRDDQKRAEYWLEQMGMLGQRKQTFRSLSGGEQQKVLIARAMAQEPKILMLDEPCANLDFNFKLQITAIIDRLYRRRQLTVLLVSHDLAAVSESCRRMILLDAGRVVTDAEPARVVACEEFKNTFGQVLPAAFNSPGRSD